MKPADFVLGVSAGRLVMGMDKWGNAGIYQTMIEPFRLCHAGGPVDAEGHPSLAGEPEQRGPGSGDVL